jgi:cytochrome P450
MGLAHFATEDDEYQGYRIPKGTAVLPNVWAILHDASIYPDPLTFDAARFVDRKSNALAGINELPDAAFGFGRRCDFIALHPT